MRTLGRVLRNTFLGSWQHGHLGFAKGAAYSALLALFPMIATITAFLVQANAMPISRKITSTVFQAIPPGAEDLLRSFLTERGAKPIGVPIMAFLIAIWASSGVTTSLMEGFQATLERPSDRSIIRQRLIAIGLVFSGVLPVLSASLMLLFGERFQRSFLEFLGFVQADASMVGMVHNLGTAIRYLVTFLTILVFTGFSYYFGPSGSRTFRFIWPGALVATVLWFVVTGLFTWYVRNIANYNVLYGSIGAVIALLVWMYLLSVISLLGFEFNNAIRHRNR